MAFGTEKRVGVGWAHSSVMFPPAELRDAERLFHLFAAHSPPDGDALDFWARALPDWCVWARRLFFTLAEAEAAFTIDGVFPASLKGAVKELRGRGVIKSLTVDDNQGLADLLKSLVKWTLASAESPDTSTYYCTALSEEISAAIECHMQQVDELDSVLSVRERAGFAHSLPHLLGKVTVNRAGCSHSAWDLVMQPSQDSMEHFLELLEGQRKLRFSADRAAVCWTTCAQIPEHLLSLHQLRLSLHGLQLQQQRWESSEAQHHHAACEAKAAGRASAALLHLRLRRNVRARLDQLCAARATLESALHCIEQTKLNTVVIAAYRGATQALRTTRKVSGLTLDNVAEAMDAFQEELDEAKELSDLLEAATSSPLESNEAEELELELHALIAAPQQDALGADLVAAAPMAPTHSLVAPSYAAAPPAMPTRCAAVRV